MSEILQQRCGSFCSTDDVMLYKVRVFFIRLVVIAHSVLGEREHSQGD